MCPKFNITMLPEFNMDLSNLYKYRVKFSKSHRHLSRVFLQRFNESSNLGLHSDYLDVFIGHTLPERAGKERTGERGNMITPYRINTPIYSRSSAFQLIHRHFDLFMSIPTYSSAFQLIHQHFDLFMSIPTYSSAFQLIHQHSNLFISILTYS